MYKLTGNDESTTNDSPPVLLSPVLSRPVRSLSAASNPFFSSSVQNATHSESESELTAVWQTPAKHRLTLHQQRHYCVTPPRCSSPVGLLPRSSSGSKLAVATGQLTFLLAALDTWLQL
uniref:Uncharacterized protein n=1 Tax=Plectus sambesii TaxID=2011161 RepID=A0A914WKR8_9BILA